MSFPGESSPSTEALLIKHRGRLLRRVQWMLLDVQRVIDADEKEAEASNEDEAPKRGRGGRRKPYNRRDKEETAESSDAAEGVMKTLSRGRRKAADSEETSAEATD